MLHSTIKQFAAIRLLVLSLCVVIVLAAEDSAQAFRTAHDGVEYAELTREIAGQPVRMNLLRLDLKKVRLDVQHAMDAAVGTEKTSSIANRHGGVAAINAGFFRLDTSIFAGDAAGTLMIDGRLWSESTNARVAIGIINQPDVTEVYFGHPQLVPTVNGEKYTTVRVDGINRQMAKDEIIVYTPEFARTTLTAPGGVEMIIKNGRVTMISRAGSNLIPQNGFILSGDGDGAARLADGSWKIGTKVALSSSHKMAMYDFGPDIEEERKRTERLLTFDRNKLFRLEDITNGIPQLIKEGVISVTWEDEKTSKSFVETRHPRTAVAKLKDGKFLMITVDGRSESSGGIGLYDLANLLLEFGATDAMNLDGGGSTTMFLDGKVVNYPSDKEGERKVSDALVVTLRKK